MIGRARALGFSLFALGCGKPEAELCAAAAECPVIDEGRADGDAHVLWATGQKLAVVLDGNPQNVEVVAGELDFTPDASDPDCTASCAITLKHLRIVLGTLYFVSSDDSVKVKELEVEFEGPSVLENPDGMGSVLPEGMKTRTCADADNVLSVHESTLGASGRLVARALNEEVTLDASVPMLVDGSTNDGCVPFHLELAGTLRGAVPFDVNPVETMP